MSIPPPLDPFELTRVSLLINATTASAVDARASNSSPFHSSFETNLPTIKPHVNKKRR